jgi:hypothetical protein
MTDDDKACPFCAETIKKAAIRCRFCQADLPPAPREQPKTYSEPAAFRMAAKTQSKFGLGRFLIGLMCLFAIAIGGGYAVRPFVLAIKNRSTVTRTVQSETTGSNQVNAKSDDSAIKPVPLLDLARKKFVSKLDELAYIHFRDDQNVDVKTEYARYSGRDMGIITGHYTVRKGTFNPEVRIEYMFDGANQVATYDARTNENGVLELTGISVEPLPSFLKYSYSM